MDSNTFSFDLVDTLEPFAVIKNELERVNEVAKGYVIGEIKEYDGPIKSFTQMTPLAAAVSAIQGSQTKTVDIQEYLGEQCETEYQYEVYLLVKGLPEYKYRLMFVNYGEVSYPVTIVLTEDLAKTYSSFQYTFRLSSMHELQELLKSVFNSEVMISIVQSLINEALRREKRKIVQQTGINEN